LFDESYQEKEIELEAKMREEAMMEALVGLRVRKTFKVSSTL